MRFLNLNWIKKSAAPKDSVATTFDYDLARKGATSAVTGHSWRKLSLFYLRYALAHRSLWVAALVLLVTSLVLTNTLLATNSAGAVSEWVRFSLIIHLPVFAATIFGTAFLAWSLFAKTKADGLFLFESAHKISRRLAFILKLGVILGLTFTLLLIMHSLNGISLLANGVSFALSLQTWLIELTASLLTVSFFSALFITFSINFSLAITLAATSISAIIFLVAPLLANTIRNTATQNNLTWNATGNRVSYARVFRLDQNAQVVQEAVVNYVNPNGAANSNNNAANNINAPLGAGVFLDGFVNTPYELMLSPLYSSAVNYQQLANDARWSMLSLGDAPQNSAANLFTPTSSSLVYGYDDLNPLQASYQDVLQAFLNYYSPANLAAQTGISDLSNATTNRAWLDRLSNEADWSQLSLSVTEVNTLRFLLGLINKAPLIFYTFRDYALLAAKYQALFTDLKAQSQNASLVDLIEFLITQSSVKSNVLNSETVITNEELNARYPVLMSFDRASAANVSDRVAMQNLISEISPETGVRIDLSGAYVTLPFSSFPFAAEASSKAAWDAFIANNDELMNLQNYYERLRLWTLSTNPAQPLRNIDFKANSLAVFRFGNSLQLSLVSNLYKDVFYLIGLIGLSTFLLWFSYYRYQKMEVK